jgi:hypothetical protein
MKADQTTAGNAPDQRRWLDAWQSAGPALESMRHEDIRRSDASGIRAVIPTADLLGRLGVKVTAATGLVEQQAWFMKAAAGSARTAPGPIELLRHG